MSCARLWHYTVYSLDRFSCKGEYLPFIHSVLTGDMSRVSYSLPPELRIVLAHFTV